LKLIDFFLYTNIAELLKNNYKSYLRFKNNTFKFTLYENILYKIFIK